MPDPLVHVIVITCDGKHHLERLLPSLSRTTYPAMHVVLLDNASTDGSADYTQQVWPAVEIMRNGTNEGFARGNNLAMQRALAQGADYVLLLNDDTVILDPQWLTHAVCAAESAPEIGMVGFDLTEDTDRLSPPVIAHCPARDLLGCALLIKSSLLQRVGLFDETYFAYFEESDLQARARRAGYTLRELNVPLYHQGGGTSGRMQRRFALLYLRNCMRFSVKNEPVFKALVRPLLLLDTAYSPLPVQRHPEKTRLRARLNTGSLAGNLGVFAEALGWNLAHLPATLRRRAQDAQHTRQARASLQREMGQTASQS